MKIILMGQDNTNATNKKIALTFDIPGIMQARIPLIKIHSDITTQTKNASRSPDSKVLLSFIDLNRILSIHNPPHNYHFPLQKPLINITPIKKVKTENMTYNSNELSIVFICPFVPIQLFHLQDD